MENKKIAIFVHGKYTAITYLWETVRIIFANGKSIYGYFNENLPESEQFKENKWNFVGKTKKGIKKIRFNGEDIKKIILIRN